MPTRGFEDLETQPEQETVVVDCVTGEVYRFGQKMVLEVNDEDVKKMVDSNKNELITEELHSEQGKEVTEELLSKEEKMNKGSISSLEIKEMCYNWE